MVWGYQQILTHGMGVSADIDSWYGGYQQILTHGMGVSADIDSW